MPPNLTTFPRFGGRPERSPQYGAGALMSGDGGSWQALSSYCLLAFTLHFDDGEQPSEVELHRKNVRGDQASAAQP